jgi:Ca2+-binding EF-hand superfamily protein
MKYFRWSEKDTLNMTYEKFTMYLSTIPIYESKAETEEEDEAVGSFNLFDLDQKL